MAGNAVIGRLVYLITGDSSALTKDLTKAQKQIRDAGQRMQRIGTQMTKFVTLPILGIGTAFVKAASDAEETAAKFGTAFRDVIGEATAVAESLAESYGLSRTESQRLLASTGDLLKGFGATGKQALGLSDQVQKLAVDLASYNNLQGGASRASEILTKAMLGEREALTSLGIKVSEAEVQQRLLATGQQDLEGRTLLLAKAQATLDLAMQQSGDAIGDFARTQDSAANQMRILRARAQDLATTLGAELLPMATELIGWARSVVERFAAMNEQQRRNVIRIAAIAAAIGPLLIVGAQLTKAVGVLIPLVQALAASVTTAQLAMAGWGLAAAGIIAGLIILRRRAIEAASEIERIATSLGKVRDVVDEISYAQAVMQLDQYGRAAMKLGSQIVAQEDLVEAKRKAAAEAQKSRQQFTSAIAREELEVETRRLEKLRQEQGEIGKLLEAQRKTVDTYERTRAAAAGAAGATGDLAAKQRDLQEEGQLLVDILRRQRDLEAELAEEAARNSAKRFEFGLMQLDESAQQIVRINLEKQEFIAAGIARVDAERWAQGEIDRIREDAAAKEKQRQRDLTLQQLSDAQQLVSQVGAIFSQLGTNRSIQLENEYETAKAFIEANVGDEQERAEALEDLDEEFAQRRKELAREEAIRNKAIAIIDSIINTAVAFTKALPNIPLAVATAVLGGIQTALIAAQPIPKAASGAEFVTRGPQLLQVGDNPGGVEQVSVTPLSSPNMRGPSDMIHVTVNLQERPILDAIAAASRDRRLILDAGSVVQR